MKTLVLLGCLFACAAGPAFASSKHHKQHKQHIRYHHQKIHNGTPNHRRAGS